MSRFERAASLLALAGAAAGVLALIGRYTEVWRLATWVGGPAVRPMQVFTAVSFVGFGTAILLGLRAKPRPWMQWLARALAVASGAVAFTAWLAQRGLLAMPSRLRGAFWFPDVSLGEEVGVPAINEGVVLVLLAVSVVVLTVRRPWFAVIGQAVAVAVATIGGVVAVAFFYGDTTLAGFPFGARRMAFSAALTASLLAIAAILSRPESGFMAPLSSPWSGGILLRRLLPFVLVLPPAAVALMLTGLSGAQRPRLLAWLAVVVSVLLGVGLMATAASVNRAGRSLQAAHDLSDRALSTVKHNAELADELRGLLVRGPEEPVDGLEIAIAYRPAEGWLAGDAAVVEPLDSSRLGMAIVDVAGHGSSRALTAFRISELLCHSMRGGMAPARALESVMWAVEGDGDMATAVVAEVDGSTGAMRYVVAGHPPVLIDRSDGTMERLEATGPVLFTGQEGNWAEGLVSLLAEDTLVVYTDGVADPQEAKDAGVATVHDLTGALARFPAGGVDELAEWCLNEATGRARGVLRDDATVVVIRRSKGALRKVEGW